MSLQIGRTVLDDPDEVTVAGDEVTFKVDLNTSSVADMKAKRQQLAAMPGNRDEEVIPVVWSEDSALNGFYEVKSVNVGSHPVMLTTGYVPPATVALRRLGGGYATSTFEVTGTNATRTNGHSMSGLPLLYIPSQTMVYDLDTFSSITAFETRPTADGVTMLVLAGGDPNGRSYRFDVAPQDYYRATCLLEIEVDGAWQVVTGRQVPRATRFRVSNGMIRLTSASSSVGATLEAWNGSSWRSRNVSFFTGSSAMPIGRTTPASFPSARDIPVSVLRNAPEQVTVRQSTFSDQVTFSMLRGARHITMHWSVSNNVTGPVSVGLGLTTGATGFSLAAGVQSAAGVGNESVIFATAAAETSDLTNCRTRNAVDALSDTLFAGFTLVGDVGLNDAASVQTQMMSGVNWRQRAVAR